MTDEDGGRAMGNSADPALPQRTSEISTPVPERPRSTAEQEIPVKSAVRSLASVSVGQQRYLVIPGEVAVVDASKLRSGR
jgi:hypothetical protein